MGEVCVHRAMTSPPELHIIFLVSWKLLWEPCRTEQNQQGIRHILSRGDGSSVPKPEELPLWNLGGEQTRLWSGVFLLEDPSHSSSGARGGWSYDRSVFTLLLGNTLGAGQMSHQSSVLFFTETGELVFSGPVGLINFCAPPHYHLSVLMSTQVSVGAAGDWHVWPLLIF